ncbi:hypothetical protein Poli38472_010681 [Pythium oligandrum]|uniref:GTP-binding protein n=1 Tax=Pythium oligandrum TaxID=41045 RepID=A0A8K1FKD4_PYTOL|nr:hypothetical protein Poli38472_010681 [Pythium oligandrum]|eukprot:TMW61618.1 hypothetical protein Poli38472_010681 [Pythium oligandrum]
MDSDSRTPATARAPTTPRLTSRHNVNKRLIRGRILFLGLDGAGKTTLIQQLQRYLSEIDEGLSMGSSTSLREGITEEPTLKPTTPSKYYPDPTKTLKTSTYRVDGEHYVQLVDLPGRRALRQRWSSALLGETHSGSTTAAGLGAGLISASSSGLLANAEPPSGGSNAPVVGVVFVVDATDRVRFPLVADELIRYQKLKDQRPALQKPPFFLLLNKIDQLETQQQEQQHKITRALRQELKKCFDHQLRMDQRRHPRDYASAAYTASPIDSPRASNGNGASKGMNTPLGLFTKPTKSPKTTNASAALQSAQAMQHRKQAMLEANANRKVLMMTSIMEVCAYDRDNIRAIHGWFKDEVRKLWS